VFCAKQFNVLGGRPQVDKGPRGRPGDTGFLGSYVISRVLAICYHPLSAVIKLGIPPKKGRKKVWRRVPGKRSGGGYRDSLLETAREALTVPSIHEQQ